MSRTLGTPESGLGLESHMTTLEIEASGAEAVKWLVIWHPIKGEKGKNLVGAVLVGGDKMVIV